MTRYQFYIQERVKPKERPRMGKYGMYTPRGTQAFERLVGWHAKRVIRRPLTGDIKVTLRVDKAVPKSWAKTKRERALSGEIRPTGTRSGDVDNLAKSVLDGLNKVAYVDDGQIYSLSVMKRYAEQDGVWIEIEEEQ